MTNKEKLERAKSRLNATKNFNWQTTLDLCKYLEEALQLLESVADSLTVDPQPADPFGMEQRLNVARKIVKRAIDAGLALTVESAWDKFTQLNHALNAWAPPATSDAEKRIEEALGVIDKHYKIHDGILADVYRWRLKDALDEISKALTAPPNPCECCEHFKKEN